jgi:threonine/homoserine/homoserine lactone efflux protein
MDAGTVLLFCLASLALIVVPGPAVGFVLATTLAARHARRRRRGR